MGQVGEVNHGNGILAISKEDQEVPINIGLKVNKILFNLVVIKSSMNIRIIMGTILKLTLMS